MEQATFSFLNKQKISEECAICLLPIGLMTLSHVNVSNSHLGNISIQDDIESTYNELNIQAYTEQNSKRGQESPVQCKNSQEIFCIKSIIHDFGLTKETYNPNRRGGITFEPVLKVPSSHYPECVQNALSEISDENSKASSGEELENNVDSFERGTQQEQDLNALIAQTPCGHIFHAVCLVTWSKISNTCPFCRLKFQKATIYGRNPQLEIKTLDQAENNAQTLIRRDKFEVASIANTSFSSLDLSKMATKEINSNSVGPWKGDTEEAILHAASFYLETSKLIAISYNVKEANYTYELSESEATAILDTFNCQICGLGDHEDVLMLCDSCNDAYHTYCTGVEAAPRGPFYCSVCVRGHIDMPSERNFNTSDSYNIAKAGPHSISRNNGVIKSTSSSQERASVIEQTEGSRTIKQLRRRAAQNIYSSTISNEGRYAEPKKQMLRRRAEARVRKEMRERQEWAYRMQIAERKASKSKRRVRENDTCLEDSSAFQTGDFDTWSLRDKAARIETRPIEGRNETVVFSDRDKVANSSANSLVTRNHQRRPTLRVRNISTFKSNEGDGHVERVLADDSNGSSSFLAGILIGLDRK